MREQDRDRHGEKERGLFEIDREGGMYVRVKEIERESVTCVRDS
jgi:hypothetical protein